MSCACISWVQLGWIPVYASALPGILWGLILHLVAIRLPPMSTLWGTFLFWCSDVKAYFSILSVNWLLLNQKVLTDIKFVSDLCHFLEKITCYNMTLPKYLLSVETRKNFVCIDTNEDLPTELNKFLFFWFLRFRKKKD